ncbi:MAG: SMP-30/gluconolactonase/LRE family protein [Xanthobacteraceae bacterium]|nr:SMP-30/gluconolactonase/LRE family protein [Xanthobacteraceae bacterium]
MKAPAIALALALLAGAAAAEPVVVASGAYPEGLLWHGGKLYFTEMGADRVTVVENGGTREFWNLPGCGPTQIVPFGPSGFVVDCHLGRAMVEVSAGGTTGRRFTNAPDGTRLQDPNAAVSDGQGGAFFSDAGIFDLSAPATGRVYHLSAMGVMTEVIGQIRYANGVNFDPATRTLYLSEHLARRVLAFTLDGRHRVTARKVLIDFAQVPAARTYSFPLAGPDGIALRPGLMAVAEYGEGRVHIFDRDGRHRSTLKVSMPFVDTVVWDGAGNLYAGGAFQNTRPPYEGAVVRFSPAEWEKAP